MNNIAPKAPLARQANQMASHGRYGDSQLVHMNPYEVQGLASMSPTGELTINPVTGQPEAFLPFLIPMIGSALGGAALGGTALGMTGASALGAGLATWAQTGDLEKGIISGVTGFGLGKVLGAGADAANLGTELGNVAHAQTGVAETAKNVLGANQAVPALGSGGFETLTPAMEQAGALTNISPEQIASIGAQQGLGTAQTQLASARAALTPAQRMGGFTSKPGFKAMGAKAMTPSAMLPIVAGTGTMAAVEKQEAMDDLAKKQLGEDKAYAQEWQDVFDESIGVANRSNQRQGRRPTAGTPNPYGGRYASGGIVGLNGGGGAFGAAQDAGMGFLPGETAQEAYARLGYIPYNSSPYYSTDDYNNYTGSFAGASGPQDTTFGLGAGSAGTIEGDQTTITDNSTPQTLIASTAAGVDSLVNQGAPLTNIRASDGSASGALSDAWADEMGGEIRGTTTGLDADNRYFVDTVPNSGAERQSFLRGDIKQKPPSDYRHGFEKEFQFFDYVDDRPIERYQDLFGAGPSDYMAGLLAGNTGNAPVAGTNTLAGAGDFSGTTGGITNTAGGITNLETESIKADCYTSNDDGTYTISKSDIYGVCPLGSYNTQAAADGAVVIDDTVVVDDTVVDTTITCYNADGETQQVTGVNPSCPVGWSETAPPDPWAVAKGQCDVSGGTWDEVNNVCIADPLAAFGTINTLASQEEIVSLVDMINRGETSAADIAARYGLTEAEVQAEYDRLMSQRGMNAALSDYGTGTGWITEEEIVSLVDLINSGETNVAAVADRYGKTEAEVQDEYDRLMAQRATNLAAAEAEAEAAAAAAAAAADDGGVTEVLDGIAAVTEDPSEPGNRSGLIRQYITDTFGEPPYTQAQAIQYSQVAIAQGISAAESAEALGLDVATVEGFYRQASNPTDVVDAQAQSEAAAISEGDWSGMSEAEIAQVLGRHNGGRTKRFMTAMGPIELAAGGIADIPVGGDFMQEMPPEVAIVQEAPDTDFPELIELTIEAIKGNVENSDTIINQFIEEYGVEEFQQLREAVLQSIVPNAQTEGRIKGSGGGMDDEVMGMIGENQQVAVSPDEYIVAADVVSGLGDGSSDAGADVLDELMANVRTARSGGRQPAPINLSRVVPRK
jgi:hypothetical protein